LLFLLIFIRLWWIFGIFFIGMFGWWSFLLQFRFAPSGLLLGIDIWTLHALTLIARFILCIGFAFIMILIFSICIGWYYLYFRSFVFIFIHLSIVQRNSLHDFLIINNCMNRTIK
jgi:hypothetical protein